jgi:Xaa-Pro aminopeptidase
VDHSDRRRRLAARLPDLEADAFLITSLPNVRYLTGFTGSNGQLVLGSDDAVFLTDGRYTEQSAHEVPDLARETYSGEFGPTFRAMRGRLGARRVAFEAAALTVRTFESLRDGIELVSTTDEVERFRVVKDPEELERLRAAQAMADEGFLAVVAKLAEGMTEREVAFELEGAMRRAGADGVAFDSIVAFGENAAEPHHAPTGRPLALGDVVKIDFGALADGYHTDTTRTIAFGDPDPRLVEIHGLVRRAQQAGLDAVRAGATTGEVDATVRSVIADGGHAEHYPHPLGHGVGLEIHEAPTLRAGGDVALPEGTVVTVEPGVYVPGLGGVRIEDMVEVRADGCRPMSLLGRDLVIA